LKRSNAMPHSKPDFTSDTSSFEAAQRRDLALVNDDVVAEEARL
jgi:hypothetical protein